MSVSMPRSINKEYYNPEKSTLHPACCPTRLTPTYRISTQPTTSRTKLTHEFTTMRLEHHTKEKECKNSLSLGRVHHQLEMNSLFLHNSGASNILLSKVSFDCLIREKSGKEYRDYISFDLRIPGANTEQEVVLTYDMVEALYGSQEKLYSAIEHFYRLGRTSINANNYQHGNCPNYDVSATGQGQFIRHTEQILVAFLARPRATKMLRNRLRTEIRGKYWQASTVKVYNMGLHIHSTKTCCAPCEYSLIGLMKDRVGLMQNGVKLGFLPNFQQACSIPNEQLSFTLPRRSYFRLLVTVSTSEADAHHRAQPEYTMNKLKPQDSVPPYIINVKDAGLVSNRLFLTMLDSGYDQRKLPLLPSLTDITVGISGSKATKGSPGTNSRVKAVRDEELDQFAISPLFAVPRKVIKKAKSK